MLPQDRSGKVAHQATNILRLLKETGLSKQGLAKKAGISLGFLPDLINYKANPSLRVKEAIVKVLHTSLPWLWESTDLDLESLEVLAEGAFTQGLPSGYERITMIPPSIKPSLSKSGQKPPGAGGLVKDNRMYSFNF
ncbi:MAG TPA: helix-turn-helix domain-containing protein [Candidatus Competibacteraceae bacterium]|nr:helix-turn-helix domain-containing protein [Candidatus Competibacteraceae bacterium]